MILSPDNRVLDGEWVMATFNGLGVAPFAPVSNVTPFTYRDGETFLSELHRIKEYIRELAFLLESGDAANRDYVNKAIAALTEQFNAAIVYLEGLIAGSHDESIAFDPTNGTHLEGLSQVVSNVYDNVRIFAYFALDLDNMDLTAAEYDAWLATMPVRHMDLAPLYPALNDVLGDYRNGQ